MDTTTASRHPALRTTCTPWGGPSAVEYSSAAGLAQQWLEEYRWKTEHNAEYISGAEPITPIAARDGLDPVLAIVTGGEENGAALLTPLAHLRGNHSGQDFILFAFRKVNGFWDIIAEPAGQTGLDLDMFTPAPTN